MYEMRHFLWLIVSCHRGIRKRNLKRVSLKKKMSETEFCVIFHVSGNVRKYYSLYESLQEAFLNTLMRWTRKFVFNFSLMRKRLNFIAFYENIKCNSIHRSVIEASLTNLLDMTSYIESFVIEHAIQLYHSNKWLNHRCSSWNFTE